MGCGSSVNPSAGQDSLGDGDENGEVSLGGRWQYEESPGVWRLFSPEINAQLLVAWYCGETKMEYTTDAGASYTVDLEAAVQTDNATGLQQSVGWGAAAGDDLDSTDADAVWIEYSEDQQELLDAWAAGKEVVCYVGPDGCEYEVDFVRMLSTNLTTGQQQAIALEPLDGEDGGELQAEEVHSPPVEVEEWIECLDVKTGKFYYHKDDQSTWEKPFGPHVRVKAGHVHDGKTPPPAVRKEVWTEYIDPKSSKCYYGNGRTTSWTKPEGPNVVIQSAGGDHVSAPTEAWVEPTDATTRTASLHGTRTTQEPAVHGNNVKEWTEYMDANTGRSYYCDGARTVWERPTGAGVTVTKDHASFVCRKDKKWTLGPEKAERQPAPNAGSFPVETPASNGQQPQGGVAAGSHFTGETPSENPSDPQRARARSEGTSRSQKPTWHGAKRGPDDSSPQEKERPAYGQRTAPTAAASGGSNTANSARPKAGAAARPKARAFRATPPGRAPKKWTLGPEKQAPPAPTGEFYHGHQQQHNGSSQPGGDSQQQGNSRQSGTGAGKPGAGPAGGIKLPEGVSWPSDPKARAIVERLFKDMAKSSKAPLKERQKAYKAACLSWHPDKNPKHQQLATVVFQFLQTLKKWYLDGAP
mmetsp:Transcript_22820/g.53320  ORF Transcript_22820/g.53320 Transcript_22820/m.53320 type:complete len:639 (-) Transcript_22820:188-2104(-)